MTTEAASAGDTEKTPDELVGRLFEASLGMMDVMSVYLGDQLGLYRALHDKGAATSSELAGRTGIDERYAREWLEQQAATGIPTSMTSPLRPPTGGPACPGPCRAPVSRTARRRSRRSAGRWSVRQGPAPTWRRSGLCRAPGRLRPGQTSRGDFNRPWLRTSFGLRSRRRSRPSMTGWWRTHPPVADVACGVGWAAIATPGVPKVRSTASTSTSLDRARAAERARRWGFRSRHVRGTRVAEAGAANTTSR
jgi:hypothetical protein